MQTGNKQIFILGLFVLILTGCDKDFTLSDEQEILFQYDYQNYAWGRQHSGYFIDRKGNILTYNMPEEWTHTDNDLIIFQEQMMENLDKCVISDLSVPLPELEKFTRHIPNLSLSKVSAIRNTGADMGSHTFICYKFDDTFKVYKGFLIKMEGDNTCENLNFFSKKVVSWLKGINHDLALKKQETSPDN